MNCFSVVMTRMNDVMNRSNVYQSLPIIYRHLGVFGTAAMAVLEDDEDVIRTHPLPIGSYYLSNSARLSVDTTYRVFSMTARQIVMQFGLENVSNAVRSAWDSANYEAWFDVVHLTEPNLNRDTGKLNARNKAFKSAYFELAGDGDRMLSESGYDESPILSPRWEINGEDVYGSNCPGMMALGTGKALQLNKILHLLDVGQLIVLTSGGEFKVTGDSNGNITGTGGFAMSGQSFNGSSDLAPINVGSVALYVQQKGSIIRDLFYSFDQDSFQSSDLTLLANHLFNGYTITDWALSVQPFSVAWCARSDGLLMGLTYLREQQVYAWHPHPLTNGYVESLCSISEGQEDAVYALIRRTINGATVRYVERLATRQFTDQADAFFVDSGLSYDGGNTDASRTMTIGSAGGWTYQDEMTLTCSAAYFDSSSLDYQIHIPYTEDGTSKSMRLDITEVVSSTVVKVLVNRAVPAALRGTAQATWSVAQKVISGLSHLEGQTVSILADGNVEPQQVIAGGSVTLENHASVVHVGLPLSALIETLDVNVASQATLLDKTKLINQLCVMINQGRSVTAGTDEDHLLEYPQREWEFYDDPIGLRTGVIDMNLDADWSRNGRVVIRHDDPLPLGVLAVIPRVTVGG